MGVWNNEIAEVKELARAHTGEAIETLVSIMTNPKSAPAARVSAANALLDRGFGKPAQHITGDGGPLFVMRLPEPSQSVEEWETRRDRAAANGPLVDIKASS
jgi:hypothetical protein